MRWIYYILLAIPLAALGGLAGGLIGSACVRWYRISSFEGGSGYYVLGLILVGTLIGGITGLVTFGVMGPPAGATYLKAFGTAAGGIVGLALVITTVSWALADIPPTIDGRPLTVELEVLLPVGAPRPTLPAEGAKEDSSIELHSLSGHTSRRRSLGTLLFEKIRSEGGRWVIPAEVDLFTRRGKRSVSFRLNGGEPFGFLLSLPASPGRGQLEWSDWLPKPPPPNPPWPETKASYRYRVQIVPEPPPEPTAAELRAKEDAEEQAAFDGLSSGSSMAELLPHIRNPKTPERKAATLANLMKKPALVAELKAQMLDADALYAVKDLPSVPEGLDAAVTEVGKDLIERIRKFNGTPVEEDPSYLLAADASVRFSSWQTAVADLRQRAGADHLDELKTILELSRIRTDSIVMRGDICRVASFYMKEWAGLEPLPTDPKPR